MSPRGGRGGSDQRGFTLVELIVVAMLGTLLLMAVYQVLLTNQRTYRENTERVQGQQAARMAMDVLVSELHEISAAGGDIIAIDSDSIRFSAMHRFGFVCDEVVYQASGVTMTVQKNEAWFVKEDSVVIFADNDTDQSEDDAWIRVLPQTVDSTSATTCSDGSTLAETLTFKGDDKPLFEADSVRSGAPIRSLEIRSYGLGTSGGSTFLVRRIGSTTTPIAGPLEEDGLTFAYYDEDGNATSDANEVHSIEITVDSGVELTTTIHPRN